MDIKTILTYTQKPPIYERGTAVMWTDEYISKQLLGIHLDESTDLASRNPATIDKTVDWIQEKARGEGMNILDLGCGPGLYTIRLAEKEHRVTGVDFSAHSIEYAKKQAAKQNLEIEYICDNYLELDLPAESFDLVLLIFTDLGVLLPEERKDLLQFVHKILKPGGTFVFDVLNDTELAKKVTPRNWEVTEKGFWKPVPYMVLSESFLYSSEKVILYQHLVIDASEQVDVYRFWTQLFSHDDLKELMYKNGLSLIEFDERVLPESDVFGGNNVTFCVVKK